MGRRKKPKPDDPEQYDRFVETAERLKDEGADERFKEVMGHILKPKPRDPEGSDTYERKADRVEE